jgi:predicted negative regulator of RcsB-dependent stress response
MAYDLQEQEQLAAMKAWWDKYGNFILTAATLVLLAIAAYNGWRWYERREAAQAAVLYDEMKSAVDVNNVAKIKEVAGSLLERYPRTVYAAMAALHAARANHESNDMAAAKAQLRWVIEKSGHPEFTLIARVRLAGVLLDEKAYDEALKLVSGDVPAAQATAFADRRGDILLAQGKPAEARAAWQQALAKADPQHPLRNIIQLKIDALPPAAAS